MKYIVKINSVGYKIEAKNTKEAKVIAIGRWMGKGVFKNSLTKTGLLSATIKVLELNK